MKYTLPFNASQKSCKLFKRCLALMFLLIETRGIALEIQCPNSIVVKEIIMNQPGWENTVIPNEKTIKTATLYAGNVGDTSSALAPEQEEKKNVLNQRWNLKAYHAEHQPVWLECQYFETSAQLSRVIPTEIRTCHRDFFIDASGNTQRSTPLLCK